MKKSIYIILLLLLIIQCSSILLTSCAKDADEGNSAESRLRITADIEDMSTRSYVQVREDKFLSGDSIGLFVLNSSNGTYESNPNAINNLCVYDGTNWESLPWIEMTATKGTVYAYYPYRKGVTGTTFTYDLSDEIDLLYGSASSTVDKTNNTANITFHHALSWITFNVTKTTTSAANAVLTDFTMGNYLEDTNDTIIANKATFDVTTGKLTATADPAAELVSTNNVSLSSSTATSINMLVIPVTMGSSGRANVMLYINGQAYEAELKNETWQAGYHYTYAVTANVGESNFDTSDNSVALYIGTPTIAKWTTGTPTTTLGTLEGDIESVPGEAVDLGLPSGTLWSDRNMGATSATNAGLYYAYGEVTPKSTYAQDNYLYYSSGSFINIGNYDNSTGYYEIAGTEYDVAHKLWGGNWHIPSKKEWEELHDNTTYSEVTINGMKCVKLTSANGRYIVFPRAGYMQNKFLCFFNTLNAISAEYRLSTGSYFLTSFSFSSAIGHYFYQGQCWQDEGMSIRPVTTK